MSSITGNNRVRDELRIVCKKRRTRTGIECLVRKTLHRHMCYALELPVDDLCKPQGQLSDYPLPPTVTSPKKSLRVAEPAEKRSATAK